MWGAWMNPGTLPQWWGPDGFSCRTQRIDLRSGGDWVFDMIGPDGTVYPNHHLYIEVRPQEPVTEGAGGRRRSSSGDRENRSEEHTSELQSLMRISYAVF